MNKLVLPLKKHWFDLIRSGDKKEEYREISIHWISRFKIKKNTETGDWMMDGFKFDTVEFTLGYPSIGDTSRRITFRNPKIRIGKGRPEWGAIEGKKYFIISWEEEI